MIENMYGMLREERYGNEVWKCANEITCVNTQFNRIKI